jgi:hypothetical protein
MLPRQGLDLRVEQRLLLLNDRDVVRALRLDRSAQVRSHRMEGGERDR